MSVLGYQCVCPDRERYRVICLKMDWGQAAVNVARDAILRGCGLCIHNHPDKQTADLYMWALPLQLRTSEPPGATRRPPTPGPSPAH